MVGAAPHWVRRAALCDSNKAQGNGMELCQGRLRLGVRKQFFIERLVRHDIQQYPLGRQ